MSEKNSRDYLYTTVKYKYTSEIGIVTKIDIVNDLFYVVFPSGCNIWLKKDEIIKEK